MYLFPCCNPPLQVFSPFDLFASCESNVIMFQERNESKVMSWRYIMCRSWNRRVRTEWKFNQNKRHDKCYEDKDRLDWICTSLYEMQVASCNHLLQQ